MMLSNTRCFSTATMVVRTLLNVTSAYIACLVYFTFAMTWILLSVLRFAFALGLSDISRHSYFLHRVIASPTFHAVACVVMS